MFRGMRVEGATAVGRAKLEALWPHRPGDTAAVSDIFALAAAITRAYRAAGFFLSHAAVPAQTVADGTFAVRVIEGYVEDVVVRGDIPARARERILRLAGPAMTERPATLAGIERALLLAGDLPGIEVRGTVSPGGDIGGARLTVDAVHDPLGVSAHYASALPESLDRDLFSMGFEYRPGGVDRLGLTGSLSPHGAYRNVSLRAGSAAGAVEIDLSGSVSRTRPGSGGLLGPVRYRGRSMGLKTAASYPLVRGRSRNLRVSAGVSANRYRSRFAEAEVLDRYSSAFLGGDYEFAGERGSSSGVRGTITAGLIFGGAAENSRAAASPRFRIVELEGWHRRPLGGLWGGRVALAADLRGQASPDALLSGVECHYGGRRFGAGFDPGALSGEYCAMASMRLGWTTAMRLPGTGPGGGMRLSGAVDAGAVGQQGHPVADERRWESARSMSLAAQVALGAMDLEVQAAWPLRSATGRDSGPRFHLSLGVRF